MAHYSLAQLEKITGITAKVLRNWEMRGMLFGSLKDYSGHRIYSQRDLEIVLRLKYLIYTKKLSLREAKAKLIDDAFCLDHSSDKGAVFAIRQVRATLCRLFFDIQRLKKLISSARKG